MQEACKCQGVRLSGLKLKGMRHLCNWGVLDDAAHVHVHVRLVCSCMFGRVQACDMLADEGLCLMQVAVGAALEEAAGRSGLVAPGQCAQPGTLMLSWMPTWRSDDWASLLLLTSCQSWRSVQVAENIAEAGLDHACMHARSMS